MKTFILAVLTADGLIAESQEQSSVAWRSKEDRKFFIEKTRHAGVVIMGANTFHTMRRPMPDRLHIVYSREPIDLPGVEVTTKEPKEVIKDLEERGYKEVAICGGSTIFTMFMEAGVVDKLYITIEPVVFGSGMTLFNKKFDAKKLNLVSMQKLGEETVLLEYDVVR
ncbi:MAG: dihydrofolate reductase family protein [Candidatus Spechtbacterales bacterium]